MDFKLFRKLATIIPVLAMVFSLAQLALNTPAMAAGISKSEPVMDQVNMRAIDSFWFDLSGPDTALGGDNLTYYIQYAYFGSGENPEALNVVITDVLPAYETFVEASNEGVNNGGTVTWNLGTVSTASPITLELTVKIAEDAPGGTITNTANISSTNISSSQDSASTLIAAGTNLLVSVNAPLKQIQSTLMTCTIYFQNFGSEAAQNVVLTDILPDQVVFDSASDGGIFSGGTVTWSVGDLAAMQTGYVSIVALVKTEAPEGSLMSNIVNIETSTAEITTDDNSATAITQVVKNYLPPGVTLVGAETGSTSSPVVYWRTPITFNYDNANDSPKIGGVDILIVFVDGTNMTGSMTGGPHSWTYTTTFYPYHGQATVNYEPRDEEGNKITDWAMHFSMYVDPAGYIYDSVTGLRISGATVTLQRPDSLGGWVDIPQGAMNVDGYLIMQPDLNPQITGVEGQYQWDTLPGTYRVHVEAPGYLPKDSIIVSVPPPVTDLHVGLTPYYPIPPVPELPAGILMGLGLAGIGGYLVIKRKQSIRTSASL